MKITALDNNTVKLLKSSQVITSVSYAVKELVENALDANAKNIEVNLHDDGLTQIEVKDDGYGIAKDDAPLVALSSYTSKIKSFDDLEALHTYGFRGEALQALSQAADVTISTKTKDDEVATLYTLDPNGNVTKSETCHRSIGTTVQVNGLFKRMPVRRQVLLNSKRANQDLKFSEILLKSFAIIQPLLRITYRRNKQMIFVKVSANSLIESITNVLGKELTSSLEWIEENCPKAKIQFMLPKKDLKDQTLIYQPGHQYIFVNKRMLIHKVLEKLLNKRIQEYFNKGAPSARKCLFLLNIVVEPVNLDINLEPNKIKGFLKNEKEIVEFVDKILMSFYQLGESHEEKNDNSNENLNLNEKIENYEIKNNNETEWPACKKRKVDFNRKSHVEKVVDFSETKINGDFDGKYDEREMFKRPMSLDIREPVLSEPDSNSDEEMTFDNKKRKSIAPKTKNKSTEDSEKFEPDIYLPRNPIKPLPDTEPESETLSQLPVVDLGEDFLTQEIREKANHRPNRLILSSDSDSLFSETDIFDDFNLNENTEVSKLSLKQRTLSLNTSEKGELFLEVDKTGPLKDISVDAWSRGHVSGIQNGVDVKIPIVREKELLKSTSITGFNIFFSQIRPELVKENPEMSVPQIATMLTNRWKELSSEEKAHYREVANGKLKQDEMTIRRAKKEKADSDKNKKRLLDMLEKMKSKKKETICKKDETLKKRTIVTMEINQEKVTKKFYRAGNLKKSVVIGPLKPSLWVVRVATQFLLLDVEQMYKKLNFTDHSSDKTNAETLETLLKQWMIEKEDMSIMHVIENFNRL